MAEEKAANITLPFTSCPNVTVVHSTATGWNDGCLGLTHQKGLTEVQCKAGCYSDVQCSVWQWVKAKGGDLQCWNGGDVHGCRSRDGDEAEFAEQTLIGGERIQHGAVRIISPNNKTETLGLKNYKEKTGTQEEQIVRCELACTTDVTCSVWEFAPTTGCWVETLPTNPRGKPVRDSEYALAMLAGENLEHYCPAPPVPPEEDEFPWPWVIAGIILALIALAAIIYALTQKKPKVKKTRAVSITPQQAAPPPKPKPPPVEESEEEEVRTVYFIPQPTFVPQTSVVMAPQYQPVMQAPMAAPMAAPMTALPMQAPMTTPLMGTRVM